MWRRLPPERALQVAITVWSPCVEVGQYDSTSFRPPGSARRPGLRVAVVPPSPVVPSVSAHAVRLESRRVSRVAPCVSGRVVRLGSCRSSQLSRLRLDLATSCQSPPPGPPPTSRSVFRRRPTGRSPPAARAKRRRQQRCRPTVSWGRARPSTVRPIRHTSEPATSNARRVLPATSPDHLRRDRLVGPPERSRRRRHRLTGRTE
jgi:hypothetical protein